MPCGLAELPAARCVRLFTPVEAAARGFPRPSPSELAQDPARAGGKLSCSVNIQIIVYEHAAEVCPLTEWKGTAAL